MPSYENTLADLKERFGARVVLGPHDIAELLAISTQAQANMRHAGTFPLPVKKIGRRVGVSIYDVAEFLASPPLTPITKSKVAELPVSEPAPNRRKRKGQHDWMLAMRRSIDFQQAVFIRLEEILLETNTPLGKMKASREKIL